MKKACSVLVTTVEPYKIMTQRIKKLMVNHEHNLCDTITADMVFFFLLFAILVCSILLKKQPPQENLDLRSDYKLCF